MDAATKHWVCPTCGTENGTAAPAATAPATTTRAGATPAAATSRGRSVFAGSERIPLIAVVVGAVIVVLAIALFWPRGDGSTPPPSPTGASPTVVTAAQALDTLCHDIPIDQNLRVDALQRTADQVRLDAKALRKAGDPATAQQAVAVAEAMEALRTKLETHGDTTAETAQLETATSAVATTCQGG